MMETSLMKELIAELEILVETLKARPTYIISW